MCYEGAGGARHLSPLVAATLARRHRGAALGSRRGLRGAARRGRPPAWQRCIRGRGRDRRGGRGGCRERSRAARRRSVGASLAALPPGHDLRVRAGARPVRPAASPAEVRSATRALTGVPSHHHCRPALAAVPMRFEVIASKQREEDWRDHVRGVRGRPLHHWIPLPPSGGRHPKSGAATPRSAVSSMFSRPGSLALGVHRRRPSCPP
jgi:hypothetical protein